VITVLSFALLFGSAIVALSRVASSVLSLSLSFLSSISTLVVVVYLQKEISTVVIGCPRVQELLIVFLFVAR